MLTVAAQKMVSTNGGIGLRYGLARVEPEDDEKEPTGRQHKDPFNGRYRCLMKSNTNIKLINIETPA